MGQGIGKIGGEDQEGGPYLRTCVRRSFSSELGPALPILSPTVPGISVGLCVWDPGQDAVRTLPLGGPG